MSVSASQTGAVVRLLREVLGDEVAGVYLYGSAVLGGLRPSSDLDLFAVVRSPPTAEQRRALVAGLLDVSGRYPRRGTARPVELTVVVRSEVSPWRFPAVRAFQYGEWLRDAYERGAVPAAEPDPDLAPLITMVLRDGVPLVGPPPGALLDPVPAADLARALAAGVPELLAEPAADTRNAVLTLARIWNTLETGEIRSKEAAAEWALPRLPREHRPPLSHARDAHLGIAEERWDGLLPAVRAYARQVAAAVERSAALVPADPWTTEVTGGSIRCVWRDPIGDEEMGDLVRSHGGDPVAGWWDRVKGQSLGWVGARDASGLLLGFVNVAWDGGDHAFLLDPKTRGSHQRRGIGTAVVVLAAARARAAGCTWLHVDFRPELRTSTSAPAASVRRRRG
ncbi:aminoglycoside adenylyltransferase family protein [Streptomyces clavuligerus]|uniref:aminoglycoside adenylyltransferase family protein n=1 Tax=Streptomyces clavuligerus TaxID=1901 RepID=UPI0030B88472